MQTVTVGSFVRITDSRSRLQETCRESKLRCEERLSLLGEVGVVEEIDPTDSTAKIRWNTKKGFMPVACLLKSDTGPDMPHSDADAAVAMALLHMLSGLDAVDIPSETYDRSKGFHFHCDLRSMNVDATKKNATCVEARKATLVTEETLPPGTSCEFRVKVGTPSKVVAWGITRTIPSGYSRRMIGESDFEGTIGALCTEQGGVVVHKGAQVASAPALKAGATVGVKKVAGNFELTVNDEAFFSFETSGSVRFAVSMCEPGQTVSILASSPSMTQSNVSTGQLRTGMQVRLPAHHDKRLTGMRVGWNSEMRAHCGQLGDVQEVSKRHAKISVKGKSFHWDLEVFDEHQRRFCYCGCGLEETAHDRDAHTRICDVCMTFQPLGSRTWRCKRHDYDLCEYCVGRPMLPSVGSRVIQGPSWKWGNQCGEPHAEGTVKESKAGEEFGVTVEWDCGNTNKYRGPPFQDVMLAHRNGLRGKSPVKQASRAFADIAEAVFRAAAMAGPGDARMLPKKSFRASSGWHFFDGLKSIMVDDAKVVAVGKADINATVVTEEVIDAAGSFEFRVKVCCAAGKAGEKVPVTVGIVDDDPKGFSSNVIGSVHFKRCIGAMCMTAGGAIVHEGKIVGESPAVNDGDVLGIRVNCGAGDFFHNGCKFHSVGLRGKFRFGVSFMRKGQSVQILSAADGSESQATVTINLSSVPHVVWGSQLKVDMDNFNEKLGSGAFGDTWKAKLETQSASRQVAVKLLKPDRMTPELRKDFALEVNALAALTLPGGEPHPYLLQLIAIVPDRHAIVTELCACDFAAYLESKGSSLGFQEKLRLVQCVAVGMAWLVERQYVHRDLKMQNILVTKAGGKAIAKIADFGLARPLSSDELQVTGTLLYMAPECFSGHFSPKTDVYSFAFVMLSAFSGKEVSIDNFMTSHQLVIGALTNQLQELLIKAVRDGKRPPVPEGVQARPRELIEACWGTDPLHRPTFNSLCSDMRQLSISS